MVELAASNTAVQRRASHDRHLGAAQFGIHRGLQEGREIDGRCSAGRRAEVDLDPAVVHASRVSAHREPARGAGAAGRDIEAQTVRAALDRGALELTGGERAPLCGQLSAMACTVPRMRKSAISCPPQRANQRQLMLAEHVGPMCVVVDGAHRRSPKRKAQDPRTWHVHHMQGTTDEAKGCGRCIQTVLVF